MHISDFDYLSDFCGEFGNGLAVLAYVIRRKSGEMVSFFQYTNFTFGRAFF